MNTRGLATSAALALSLLLILSCAGRAGAQSSGVGRVFRGWVGEYAVRMTLRRGAGGELSGSYSYEGRGGELSLKGTVGADGSFTLDEYDGAKQTGNFKGQWHERDYEPEARIEGDWTKPGGGGGQSFSLSEELAGGGRVTSKRIKEENKQRGYSIDAEYPQVEGAEGFNRLVESFVTKEVGDFKRNPGGAPRRGEPANDLHVNYSMRLATDEFQSVEFTTSHFEQGMIHPQYWLSVINYDRKSGRQLELADLFRPGSSYLQKISSAAVARLRKMNEEDGGMYLNDAEWDKGASPELKNYQNWTLTARGLAVTFEPYQVGPFAAGAPAVLIPYAELKGVIRPGGPLASLSK
ncbi:MAG: hypothetical protein DMF67_02485 [Acidobacteria bacterium]|nr:MAG: hypothetical protein DMF66_04235 [Acidobacteriota bacterium]PYS85016.1 MAG: hypothetical protein DMF67_02485 [Acidobacteriota bacterium]